jgi:dihydrodipicolinate synthase/N-acetylneuraminate lyase
MSFPDGTHNILVSPFCRNYSTPDEYNEPNIDYISLTNLYYKYVKIGYPIQGIVLLSSTGENNTLSNYEKSKIVSHIWNLNIKQLPENQKFITVEIGGNNTSEVLNNAQNYEKICNGFMMTIPYNKYSYSGSGSGQRGIIKMFERVSKAYPNKPIIITKHKNTSYEYETIIEIIKICPNVVALKETNTNTNISINFYESISKFRKIGNSFKIFACDQNIKKIMNDFNGNGVFSVVGNIYPILIHSIVSKHVDYIDYLHALVKILFSDTEYNPVPVKWILVMKKYIEYPTVREPLMEFDDGKIKQNIINILNECDRIEKDIVQNL